MFWFRSMLFCWFFYGRLYSVHSHMTDYTCLCCSETCVHTYFMQVHFYLCSTTLNIHQKGLKMSIVVAL